jgi:23S rRNA (cytidine2498-2'-O)-methyltransferase
MHVLLWAEDSEAELRTEIAAALPGTTVEPMSTVLVAKFPVVAGVRLPHLVFARQWLPNARKLHAESVRAWGNAIFTEVAAQLPEGDRWFLHIEPRYSAPATHRMGARAWHSCTRFVAPARPVAQSRATLGLGRAADPAAGRNRCRLIREALLEMLAKKRRHLLRRLSDDPRPFSPDDSLVQVLLTSPEAGWISVAASPLPFEQRQLLSPFPSGEIEPATDKSAPSRAFAKFVEAQARLGREIHPGESCVDLGASPGSWTYVAVNQGGRVLSVDRSPLRDELMRHSHVQYQQGDAFRFTPSRPVDWLLCDVIAPIERSADLLLRWLRCGWCRHFVVTLKLKDDGGTETLSKLKSELPQLASTFWLTRLTANKKEACAFGSVALNAV